MAADLTAILAALKADPEARATIRRELLTEELLALPAQTDARFAEFASALAQLTERMDQLTERMDQLTAQVSLLAQAQARTDQRLSRVDGHLGRLLGADYEAWVLRTARSVAGAVGAGPGTLLALDAAELDARLDRGITAGLISSAAAEEVARANGVYVWERETGRPAVYCVVEVSLTVDGHDVERAQRRAALLARIGVEARPVLLGAAVADDAKEAIEMERVAWREVPPRKASPVS
ncbi:MAG: hypothetical protein ACYCYK_07685 [Candidatus Dormibacteria bacterium]